MNDLLKIATGDLERFLSTSLPALSAEWWKKHVIDRLSFQQQRFAEERRLTALRDLDFAALLRVLVARILAFCHGDQNVKFMMTTIRRQAASCLYGLVPLLDDMLLGKLDKLEIMEAGLL